MYTPSVDTLRGLWKHRPEEFDVEWKLALIQRLDMLLEALGQGIAIDQKVIHQYFDRPSPKLEPTLPSPQTSRFEKFHGK